MANVSIMDIHGKEKGTLDLNEAVFGIPVNKNVIREALSQQLANRRLGTASTKTRGEVSGGGAKPWRQKGTGRARAGSSRSPLWRHGGTTFGPSPRSYSAKVNKKKKRIAIKSVLTSFAEEQALYVLDEISISAPKTKEMAALLKTIGLKGKTLILMDNPTETIQLAARNLPDVKVLTLENINVFDLLYHDNLLTTEQTIRKIEEIFA